MGEKKDGRNGVAALVPFLKVSTCVFTLVPPLPHAKGAHYSVVADNKVWDGDLWEGVTLQICVILSRLYIQSNGVQVSPISYLKSYLNLR